MLKGALAGSFRSGWGRGGWSMKRNTPDLLAWRVGGGCAKVVIRERMSWLKRWSMLMLSNRYSIRFGSSTHVALLALVLSVHTVSRVSRTVPCHTELFAPPVGSL